MSRYSKYIDPYVDLILENKVEHCKEQEQMLRNIVLPVLARNDVYIDDQKIEQGLSLQKYFPYKLIAWEVFLFALIVGVHLADGDIFFKDIRVIVGRGSGKNGFISFLCFYFISPYHGIDGYNVDLLANSEEQAKTSFDDVYNIIKDPVDTSRRAVLKANYHATKELITGKKTKSKLRFNTSSKRGKDSKRTGCVIYDEKHEYLDPTNINTLRSGLGKVWHGREITITTDGHIREAVLDKEKEQNREILKAYDPENRTLVFWCRIEKEEEWKQIDKLVKAIPSLNSDLLNFRSLRSTIVGEIRDMPFKMDYFPEFMAKRCNFPIGNADTDVAEYKYIQATNRPLIDLAGYPCVGGVDYAKTNDFIGCVLLFRVAGVHYVLHHTFICKRSRDLPGIKAPLDEWEKAGDVTIVDSVEVPPEMVAGWFREKSLQYQIKKLAIDSYRYALLNSRFKEVGFDADNGSIKLVRPGDIMRIIPVITSTFVTQKYVWGDVPIMRWYTRNTKKVYRGGGNYYYEKIDPNFRKTDGFMALVNCMAIEDAIPDTVPSAPMAPIII